MPWYNFTSPTLSDSVRHNPTDFSPRPRGLPPNPSAPIPSPATYPRPPGLTYCAIRINYQLVIASLNTHQIFYGNFPAHLLRTGHLRKRWLNLALIFLFSQLLIPNKNT